MAESKRNRDKFEEHFEKFRFKKKEKRDKADNRKYDEQRRSSKREFLDHDEFQGR